jgi:hypothetical protein
MKMLTIGTVSLARFPVAADLPIEALEMNPLACSHNRAIQNFRQFVVSHPNLTQGHPSRV